MASRNWLRHWSIEFEPPGATLGDEWYDISRNRLYKRVAGAFGREVQWAQLLAQDNTGNVTIGGSLFVTGNVVTEFSDLRLKDVQGPIENAIEKIKLIDTIHYRPNNIALSLGAENKLSVGVTAQSVKAVMPEVVHPSPLSSEYDAVQYDKLVPLLIAAIKEQQQQIDELKKRMED